MALLSRRGLSQVQSSPKLISSKDITSMVGDSWYIVFENVV